MGSYRLVKMLNPISITVNGTFTPKGAYNGATSYSVGDQVDYNGTSYILYSAASAGTLPTDNTKWGVLASKGDQGIQGIPGTPGTPGADGADGADGTNGTNGLPGADGADGVDGTNGQGVPVGGTAGQQLAKINGTDYNTQWVNPVDISGKQDTLVSGTSIKTVNSTSLLGSGDIVIGGAVDSVNTQTGAVVLDTDDIAEGTNKYVTSAEKTKLSNTSGVNTGDQDISGIATNASNITGKVSKAGDTMTGTLKLGGGTPFVLSSPAMLVEANVNNPTGIEMTNINTGNSSDVRFLMKDSTGHYLAFSQPAPSNTLNLFTYTRSTADYLFTHGGTSRTLVIGTNTSGDVVLGTSGAPRLIIDSGGTNSTFKTNIVPGTNNTYNSGSPSAYFLNTYTQKLYLNSTAYIDGSTAGVAKLTGRLDIPVTTSTDGQITQGGSTILHTYTRGDGYFPNLYLGKGSGNYTSATTGATYLGTGNLALGFQCLQSITTGYYNIALGNSAGIYLTTGFNNFLAGHTAGNKLTTGSNNFLMGRETGYELTTGSNNVGIGLNVLRVITTAGNNTAVGHTAGFSATGSANIFLGYQAGYNETGSNKLYIANSSTSTPLIGGDFSANTITTPASIEITDTAKGVILKSPDGTRWRVTIDNTGALTTASI